MALSHLEVSTTSLLEEKDRLFVEVVLSFGWSPCDRGIHLLQLVILSSSILVMIERFFGPSFAVSSFDGDSSGLDLKSRSRF